MKGFILLLLTFFIIPAQAGIVIYGTRVIYPAGKNEVMVQLMNRGDRVWKLPSPSGSCCWWSITSSAAGC